MPDKIGNITYYTIVELAKLLKISTKTLYKYVEEGLITGRKVGRRILITENSLQDFLEKKTKGHDNEE